MSIAHDWAAFRAWRHEPREVRWHAYALARQGHGCPDREVARAAHEWSIVGTRLDNLMRATITWANAIFLGVLVVVLLHHPDAARLRSTARLVVLVSFVVFLVSRLPLLMARRMLAPNLRAVTELTPPGAPAPLTVRAPRHGIPFVGVQTPIVLLLPVTLGTASASDAFPSDAGRWYIGAAALLAAGTLLLGRNGLLVHWRRSDRLLLDPRGVTLPRLGLSVAWSDIIAVEAIPDTRPYAKAERTRPSIGDDLGVSFVVRSTSAVLNSTQARGFRRKELSASLSQYSAVLVYAYQLDTDLAGVLIAARNYLHAYAPVGVS
jgi:hypothetical protein